ncbi:hypothetical protein Hamer_G028707 [Homarus americanus]|uniref:C-type lectin domain-containing protein n=1 Tax=Homarus americanus TaxID=6706 RepID=A0A8J5MYP1_HOMAM|nr:hypothetical protein Hamer_G028707 [Homarus americanus]
MMWSTMVARCPKGWQHRGGSDQCFLIHHYGDIRKFSDARSYCKAHGGDLATIDTTTTRAVGRGGPGDLCRLHRQL